MQPTRQDLISRSEVRKMMENKIEKIRYYGDMEPIQELLSELDNLSLVSGWIPVTELSGNIKCLFTDFNEYGVGYKFRDDYTGISFIPTHFMPLPPHP